MCTGNCCVVGAMVLLYVEIVPWWGFFFYVLLTVHLYIIL